MQPLGSLQVKSGGVTAHFNVFGHVGNASLMRNYIITGLSGKPSSAWQKKSDKVRLLCPSYTNWHLNGQLDVVD